MQLSTLNGPSHFQKSDHHRKSAAFAALKGYAAYYHLLGHGT